jgi:hypothetical protein
MNCIGVNAATPRSMMFDLFGFSRGRVPTDPVTTEKSQVSLRDLLTSLQGARINLNIIRVGVDRFTAEEFEKIDYALYRARTIYRQVSLGIGRVQHYDVRSADAGGRDDLGSEDEAEDLTHDWTVANDGLDVFMVDNISDSDFVGISPVGGPCDKNSKGMNGVVGGEVNRDHEGVARTFAHEIGHYLGLPHNHGDTCPSATSARNNLMAQTRCTTDVRTGISLTSTQGATMRGHCAVRNGC